MRTWGFAILASAFLSAALFAADKPLSLAEKLAIAKRMADEGVQGKGEAGRVISGKFSFSDIVNKYRQEVDSSADAPKSEGISADNDMLGIVREPKETSQAPSADVVAAPVQSPQVRADKVVSDLSSLPEPKIELIKKPETFPLSAKSKEASLGGAISETTVKESIPTSDSTSNARISETPSKSPSSAASEKSKDSESPKYVVDTSTGFVNGFFVGKIDSDELNAEKKSDSAPRELPSPTPSDTRYYDIQNDIFYLVSDDYSAISTGAQFIKNSSNLANSYFSSNGSPITFTRKITLQLIADKDFEMDGDFSVMVSESGDITLAAKWTPELPIDGFCKLLTGAILRKIALESGFSDWKNPPYWLELAFAAVLEQEMRFGTAMDLAAFSSQNPPPLPRIIFNYSRDDGIDDAKKSADSFWALKSIERASRSPSALEKFMKFALSSPQPDALQTRLRNDISGNAEDFDLWWTCLISGEIWSRMGGVDTPAWSDSEVVRLAVLPVDDALGERTGLSGRAIFDMRKSAEAELKMRIMEVRIALSKVNPIYYNALLDLGVMYESAFDSDLSAFEESESRFLSELSAARELAARVKALMEKKSTEVSSKTADNK